MNQKIIKILEIRGKLRIILRQRFYMKIDKSRLVREQEIDPSLKIL